MKHKNVPLCFGVSALAFKKHQSYGREQTGTSLSWLTVYIQLYVTAAVLLTVRADSTDKQEQTDVRTAPV